MKERRKGWRWPCRDRNGRWNRVPWYTEDFRGRSDGAYLVISRVSLIIVGREV